MTICRNIIDILNPQLYYRFWTVSVNDIHVGKAYPFWRKSKAIALYEKVKDSYPEVTVTNEITKEVIYSSDNWNAVLINSVWRPSQINFEDAFAKLP